MEKRVKQEAQSILANCNLKIFGKLEDPGDTKKFFQDHVGQGFVFEGGGMTAKTDTISGLFMNKPFYDNMSTSGIQLRVRADYDHLRGQREGEVHMLFAEFIARVRMFYAVADRVNALRVHRLLPVPATTTLTQSREKVISEVASRFKDPDWTASAAPTQASRAQEITSLAETLSAALEAGMSSVEAGAAVVGGLAKIVKDKPRGAAPSEETVLFEDDARVAPRPVAVSWNEKEASASSVPQEKGKAAFEDLEVEPLYETQTTSSPRGFMPRDIDTNVVPPVREEKESADVTKLALPENIAAVVESMADKLNKGLGGKEKAGE